MYYRVSDSNAHWFWGCADVHALLQARWSRTGLASGTSSRCVSSRKQPRWTLAIRARQLLTPTTRAPEQRAVLFPVVQAQANAAVPPHPAQVPCACSLISTPCCTCSRFATETLPSTITRGAHDHCHCSCLLQVQNIFERKRGVIVHSSVGVAVRATLTVNCWLVLIGTVCACRPVRSRKSISRT